MADLRGIVYWELTPGRWGRGEFLYIEGDRALVDVWIEGGHELLWIEVSKLVKKGNHGHQQVSDKRLR